MSFCHDDLENGVSKMLQNYTTLLGMIEKEFDTYFLKKCTLRNKVVQYCNLKFKFWFLDRVIFILSCEPKQKGNTNYACLGKQRRKKLTCYNK